MHPARGNPGYSPKNDTTQKYKNVHAPVIAAKEAYKYIGRMVIVHDSLYSGAVINDTTITCQMGAEANTPRLTLLAIYKQADMRFFNTFKRSKVWIWGIISGTKDAPVIILRNLATNFILTQLRTVIRVKIKVGILVECNKVYLTLFSLFITFDNDVAIRCHNI